MDREKKILNVLINLFNEHYEIENIHLTELLNSKIKVSETERNHLLQLLVEKEIIDAKKKNGLLYFKVIDKEMKDKRQYLEDIDTKILDIIEESNSKGCWKKELKQKLNLNINIWNSSLKKLDKLGFIKTIKGKEKNKQIYIKHDIQPDENLIGNNFYWNGDIDHNYLNQLKVRLKKILIKREVMSLKEVIDFLKKEKDYENLEQKEIEIALNIMLLSEEIESYKDINGIKFKINNLYNKDIIKGIDIPCYNCNYFDVCAPGSKISPENCQYYEW